MSLFSHVNDRVVISVSLFNSKFVQMFFVAYFACDIPCSAKTLKILESTGDFRASHFGM